MNNLKLYWKASLGVELQSEDEVLLFSAVDVERNRLFFASSANFVYTTQLSSLQVSLFVIECRSHDIGSFQLFEGGLD